MCGEREIEETLLVHSYDREPLDLDVDLLLAADFEPMLAIRGIVDGRARRGRRGRAAGARRALRGARAATAGTARRRSPPTGRASAATARARCASRSRSRPAAPRRSRCATRCTRATSRPAPPAPGAPRAPPRAAARPTRGSPSARRCETDDELFNRVLRRSLLDIRMLHSRLGGDGYYAAGVPWYATLFGRDSLITATQMLAFDPPMAEQTLRVLAGAARRRATTPRTTRSRARCCTSCASGEVARLGLSPLARYYGTVDATPLFLCLLCEHADWSGDLVAVPRAARRGRRDARLDRRPGRPRRRRAARVPPARAEPGLRNQGWKDSDEGVLDERGTPLEPPVALVEPQALRAARQAPARAPVRARRRRGARAGAARRGRRAARAAGALLAARARLLLDGLRRRRPPERGARLQPGPPAVGARAAAGARAGRARRADVRRDVLRLGHPHARPTARRATTRSATTSARSGRTTPR